MTDEFANLYGRSFVSFAREEASSPDWDVIFVNADGSADLYERYRLFTIDGPPDPPKPPLSARFLAVIEAARVGRVRLLADGDETLKFVQEFVPAGLLRGRWMFNASKDGNDWLRARETTMNSAVGPVYQRPHFAPPDQPLAAHKTGTAGRPTSWHLVEAEFRRRYANGERHAGHGPGGESPSAWTRVLIASLKQNHPDAPTLGLKAARNNLSPLLRELAKSAKK
jgi:hypothetical protein